MIWNFRVSSGITVLAHNILGFCIFKLKILRFGGKDKGKCVRRDIYQLKNYEQNKDNYSAVLH